ncbi:MAG: hypothetical protein ACLQDY_07845 [Streptosporangiaceae bacterium]
MRALRMPPRRLVLVLVLAAAAVAMTALEGPAGSRALAARAAVAAVGGGAGGGCHYAYQPPSSWILQCSGGGSTPGSPGSGGGGSGSGGSRVACTLTPLSPGQQSFAGLPKAPKGEKWETITCPGRNPFGGVTLVSAAGTPAVTPQELMQEALGLLKIPTLRPGTAPPMGHDGLVGLPEWFWVPAGQWHPVSKTVSVAAVWATVTATPVRLTFLPGGGLPADSCAGPGTAYARGQTASSACQFTYAQSSAQQPGAAYRASVTVTWRVTWTGSGGTGGTINAAEQIGYPIALRVAEAQALVRGR